MKLMTDFMEQLALHEAEQQYRRLESQGVSTARPKVTVVGLFEGRASPDHVFPVSLISRCATSAAFFQPWPMTADRPVVGGNGRTVRICTILQKMFQVGEIFWRNAPQVKYSPFLERCQVGVLQYVPVTIVGALLGFFLQMFGAYREGNISLSSGWLYLVIVRNFSQMVALYSLVLFYRGTTDLLQVHAHLPADVITRTHKHAD
jgi:hypothetical protein